MTDYTYNTGNPIGSTDVRDGVDNLKSFDVLLNSAADTYQDRLGNTVPTAAGAIKRLGPVVVSWTFTTGGTLNYPNEAALNPSDGNYYGWTGEFPHVVAPGTDPTLPGSGYVPRSFSPYNFYTISNLTTATHLTAGDVVHVAGYESKSDGCGHNRLISESSDGSGVPVGSLWANVIPDPDGVDVKWLGPDVTPHQIRLMLQYGAVFKKDVKLSSLSRAFSLWAGKQEYPIAFFGDSTTDGATTTGHTPSTPTVDGVSITESPNAYCKILEDAIKRAIPNYPSGQRIIYNAGFDSQSMANNFAIDKFNSIFIDANAPFVNARMIGFAWGVTDVINNNDPASALLVYKRDLEALSIYALAKGRQPFIVSPVPMWVTGTNLRNGWQLLALIDEANQDIASRYNVEIISLRDAIELDTEVNGNPLTYFSPDKIHPNDAGHSAIAGGLFSQLCPNIFTKDDIVACGSPNIMRNSYVASVVQSPKLQTKYDFFFAEGTYRFFVYLDEPRVLVADTFNQGSQSTISPPATTTVTSYNSKQTVNRSAFSCSLDFYLSGFGPLMESAEYLEVLPVGLSEITLKVNAGFNFGALKFVECNYAKVENITATNQRITQKFRDLTIFSKGLPAHDSDFDMSQYYLCKGSSTFTINAVGYNILNSAICFNISSDSLRYNYIKLLSDKIEWWVVIDGVHTKTGEAAKDAAFDTATLVNANNRVEIAIASVVNSTSSADTITIKINGATAYANLASTSLTLRNIKQGWGVGLYDLDINGKLKTLSDVVVVSNK